MLRIYLHVAAIFTFSAGLLSQNVLAQSHYTSCLTRTGNSAVVIVPAAIASSTGGAALDDGDEIALFTPDGACAGVGVWNGENIAITVWGADEFTSSGFTADQPLSFRIWDTSASAESTADPTYSNAESYLRSDGLFEVNAIYALASFSASTAPSSAPVLVSPSSGATAQPIPLTFIWRKTAGSASYEVQISTSSNFSPVAVHQADITDTTFTTSSLSGNTRYYWRVRAIGGGGSGAYSAAAHFTTAEAPPASPLLSSPADSAANVGTSPNLLWSRVPGATSYDVQVSAVSDFSSLVINGAGITSTSYSAGGLTGNTTYYWRVRSVNTAGAGNFSAARSFTTTANAASIPVLLSPASGATDQPMSIPVSWQRVSGAVSYNVQVSTTSSFSDLVVDVTGITGTSYTVSDLDYNTEYYWRIQSVTGSGPGYYSTVAGFTTKPAVQQLALPQGWSMVSSFVEPEDKSLDAVFESALGSLVLVKDQEGLFWPEHNINTLGEWSPAKSYQVFTSAPTSITLSGDAPRPEDTPIPLEKGWSMVAYLRTTAMPADQALASLAGRLVLVKDDNGGIYLPENDINTLGALQPGSGYMLYTRGDDTLTYPANTAAASKTSEGNRAALGAAEGGVVFSAHVAVLASGLPDGEIISAWVGAQQVGSGAIDQGKTVVLIYGDDPYTEEVEGARGGDFITLKTGAGASQKSLEPETIRDVLTDALVTSVVYLDNAAWVASLSASVGGESEKPPAFELEQNFPNPFSSTTTVRYAVDAASDVQLEVFNMLGQQVRVLVSEHKLAGRYEVSFDAYDLASGVYICRLRAGDQVTMRRMVLVK